MSDLKAFPLWQRPDDEAIDRLLLRIDNSTVTRADWDAIQDEIARARAEGAAELEQQLAARDGEIADWLRAKSNAAAIKTLAKPGDPLWDAIGSSFRDCLARTADAIASGAYRSNADARPRAEGE